MPSVRLLLVALCLACTVAADLVGCSGTVKLAPGLTSEGLDFSEVKIGLFAGTALREEIECAPNGYFFLPVDVAGTYVLRATREGWSFDPESATVQVTASQCNAGKDVQFTFVGFVLSGKVVSASGVGLAGVDVELSSARTKAIVRSAADGSYEFPKLLPGKYMLKASHFAWVIEAASQEVQLEWASRTVTPFVVSGFSVEGDVQSLGEPLSGVRLFLYPQNGAGVVSVGCSPVPSAIDAPEPGALCLEATDAKGHFVFRGVPAGMYRVVPYRGGAAAYDITPPFAAVTVGAGSAVVPTPFLVRGFSATGRVLGVDGSPIEGARIMVNKKFATTSDKDGSFVLDALQTDTYQVTAQVPRYTFDVRRVSVSPSSASIGDLVASSVELCGVVRLTPVPSSRPVHISADGGKPTVVKADNTGRFCVSLPAGEYTVAPQLVAAESDAGIVLAPATRRVSLTKPLPDLVFEQALSHVSGRVHCYGECPKLTVTLAQAGKTVASVVTNGVAGDFYFEQVAPGTFSIAVQQPRWCFEDVSKEITVPASGLDGVSFRQVGYQLSTSSSHATPAALFHNGAQLKTLLIPRGLSSFCVADAGRYEIVPQGCIRFGADRLAIATDDATPLALVADRFLIEGTVRLDAGTPALAHVFLLAEVVPNGATIREYIEEVKALPVPNQPSVYRYSLWAAPGTRVLVHPMMNPVAVAGAFLVQRHYPETDEQFQAGILFSTGTLEITVPSALPQPAAADVQPCLPRASPISGRRGLFLAGAIHPALADVEVCLAVAGQEQTPVHCLRSAADGTYRFGPLDDAKQYTMRAAKLGYAVAPHPSERFSFTAARLAQVDVKVVAADGSPVPGVVLSLSSESYRHNAVSDAQGSYTFAELAPGAYFLRPMLKEYAFEPATQTIRLAEGQPAVVPVTARRVAFSVYGTVHLASGAPAAGVLVRAVESDGSAIAADEVAADAEGAFRLRGLTPGKQYDVSIKSDTHTAVPRRIPVKMGTADVTGLHMSVFAPPPHGELSGVLDVDAPAEVLAAMGAVLIEVVPDRAGASPILVHTVASAAQAAAPFFLAKIPLTQGAYVVRAKLARPFGYIITEGEQVVRLNATSPHAHLSLRLIVRSRPVAHEAVNTRGPLYLALLLGAAGVAYTVWVGMHPRELDETESHSSFERLALRVVAIGRAMLHKKKPAAAPRKEKVSAAVRRASRSRSPQ